MTERQAAVVAHICGKVCMVAADEALYGVLSCGERIPVALVLDRYDLLQRACGTIAQAVHRLGPQWTEASLRACSATAERNIPTDPSGRPPDTRRCRELPSNHSLRAGRADV